MRSLIIGVNAVLLSLALGACSFLGVVKDKAYDGVAKVGNTYCENRDPVIRDELLGRVNDGIADHGGNFVVEGVTCLETAPTVQ